MFKMRLILTLAVFSLLRTPAPAQEAKPVRVGVLGLDNYQAIAFTQLFNDPKAAGPLAGLRVVAAYAAPASEDIPESVSSWPKWKADIVKFDVKLVDSVDELLRRCDVVMIMSLDGRKHLEQATPVLKAGKRLYIGRPLAATLNDAVAILKLAEKTGNALLVQLAASLQPGVHRHARLIRKSARCWAATSMAAARPSRTMPSCTGTRSTASKRCSRSWGRAANR